MALRADVTRQRLRDQAVLVAILEEDSIQDKEREAFEDMLLWVERKPLTSKQRSWVNQVANRLHLDEAEGPTDDGTPIPERFTAGDVPRGKEVELMVKDHPLRPPTRVAKP